MSINKIHVNSSTCMTLNDRFTAIQSTGPKISNSISKKLSQRRTKNSATTGVPKASLANRKFLERLEQRHKIQMALKLKRRSLKSNIPARQRIQTRIGLKKGAAKAIRLTPNGKLLRSNSLSNIATMKADLIRPTLKRSNSASNIALRLGARRLARGGAAGSQLPRRQLKRSASKQRLAAGSRSRSRSVSNLRRTNSKINLRRTNSKGNLNINRRETAPPQKRINRNQIRSASRQRKRSSSVSGRLGRPNNINLSRRRFSQNGINGEGFNTLRGRVPFRRRNSTGTVGNKGGAKQGRISRPRGRGNSIQQRGRSRSRSRIRNQSVQGGRGGRGARGNQRGRGRGRSRVRGTGRVARPDIKKEDLDKELDQYMANSGSTA